MGRVTRNGVIYEGDDQNGWVVVGYADAPAPQQAPQPVVLAPAPRTQPDIRTIGDTIVSVDPASGGVTPLYTAPEGRDTKAATEASAAAAQRDGNLRALRLQIDDVRNLYRENLRGGLPNSLVNLLPNAVYPALGEFESAGAGLAETGNAAFRVQGMGAPSDADAERFTRANTPSPGDSDATIEQKLRNLETRLNETIRAMGRDPAEWTAEVRSSSSGPQQGAQRDQSGAAIPRTAGVGADPSAPTGGIAPRGSGPTTQSPPALRGLSMEIRQMLAGGAPLDQIQQHYRQRLADAGYPNADVSAPLGNIAYAYRELQANPRKNLNEILSGWDALDTITTPAEDVNAAQSLLGNIADSDIGAAAISAGNAASGGLLRNLGGDYSTVLDTQRNERPLSALTGDVVGSAVAMSGVNRAGGMLANGGSRLAQLGGRALTGVGGIGGDAAYGAFRGAAEADPGNRLEGAFLGGGLGAGGNFVGSRLTSGLGRVTRGVSDDAVRYLNDRNISLTPGQILGQSGWLGRGLRSLENSLESVPVIGQTISQRRADGVDDYFRERVNDVLEPIGAQAQGTVGQDMLENARNSISNAYGVLDNRAFQLDQPAIADMSAAMQAGRTVPRVGEEFGAVMDRNVAPLFGPQGQITGRGLQDALQQVRSASTTFSRDGAMGNMAADAAGQIDTALTGLVNRQAPDVMPQLDAANRSYSGLVPLQDAQISAINQGVPTPAQVRRAATSNTRRFGGRARAAEGDYLGSQLDEYAQRVIPSIVNNSGTADRGLAALALPTALGGAAAGAGTFTDSPTTAGLLATIAALSTRQGNRLAQRALVSRPDAMRRAGTAIQSQRRRGGMFGAALPMTYVPMLAGEQ